MKKGQAQFGWLIIILIIILFLVPLQYKTIFKINIKNDKIDSFNILKEKKPIFEIFKPEEIKGNNILLVNANFISSNHFPYKISLEKKEVDSGIYIFEMPNFDYNGEWQIEVELLLKGEGLYITNDKKESAFKI